MWVPLWLARARWRGIVIANPVDDLGKEFDTPARCARIGLPDMDVSNGRTGLRRLDRRFGDFLGRLREIRVLVRGVARTGDGARNYHVTIHEPVPFLLERRDCHVAAAAY